MSNDSATGIECVLADPAAIDRAAWELIARGWAESERAGQWAAVADLLDSGLQDSLLVLEARGGGHLIGAVLAQLLPGKTAVIVPPQVCPGPHIQRQRAECTEIEDRLLALLDRELQLRGISLAQCLTPFQEVPEDSLNRAGYAHTADLLYLVASSDSFEATSPALPFRLLPADPDDETRLCGLLERTYVGTLDCPQIEGIRAAVDVLRGYRATGEYRPGLWQIVEERGNDVGCVLLTYHPAGNHCELIYLGLVPEVRGRGWGTLLTALALQMTRAAGAARLVLAVDASNEPAVRMYVAAGFSAWDRRRLWIKVPGIPK